MPFYEARYSCAARIFDKSSYAAYKQRQFKIYNGKLLEQFAPAMRFWEK